MKTLLPALLLLAVPPLLPSCVTVDVERRARGAAHGRDAPAEPVFTPPPYPPPDIVTVERPVYVPASEAPPRGPAAGQEAVTAMLSSGVRRPEEYSRGAMVYDWHPDFVYEVYCQPLRATDIILEPGEEAAEPPFVADSERWMLGAGVNRENGLPVQHIYVKPVAASLSATLVINTDRRSYHIILSSFRDTHMPMVRWRYPATGMPERYIAPVAAPGAAPDANPALADPRLLSLNYRVTYTLFGKPRWLPRLVCDDGRKTYIVFPENVLQEELPAVFGNRNDVVNYRVHENAVIIDRLVTEITVRLGRRSITITKKRGQP